MSLFLVTTGWQGNGSEGVIVEADDEPAALDAAADALRKWHDDDLATWRSVRGMAAPEWAEKSHAEHIADTHEREGWKVEPITLPHVGEFG